jgi:hypothetical protein
LAREQGIVRELIPRVDILSRFEIPENLVIGLALLGSLAKRQYSQITIHTGALAETEEDY